MSTTPRCHRLLQWAAEDLTDPAICSDPERLDWKRQAVINWLAPDIDEVVELAWRQLQADIKKDEMLERFVAVYGQDAQTKAASAPPICVDCRYYRAAPVGDRFDMCQSPEIGIDLVRGEPIHRPCENMRNAPTRCGESGQWFESLGDDLISSKPLQPCGVSRPGSVSISGNTPIFVQVYALGRGVTVVTERGNLSGREGTLELEANGKIFVFEPVNAGQAYGFVTPVEGDVPTIILQLQAVDQEHLAKFGDGIGHGDNSQKTVILSLPSGFGKTSVSRDLADALGCSWIVDEWAPAKTLTPGALHLTNDLLYSEPEQVPA